MNAIVNRRPGSATLSGVSSTPTWPLRALSSIAWSEASGFKGLEALVRVERHVFDDLRAPIFLFVKQPKAQRDPRRCARRQEPDDNARRKLA